MLLNLALQTGQSKPSNAKPHSNDLKVFLISVFTFYTCMCQYFDETSFLVHEYVLSWTML